MLVAWYLSLEEVDLAILVQSLNKAVSISQGINTLGKGLHPTILPPALGK